MKTKNFCSYSYALVSIFSLNESLIVNDSIQFLMLMYNEAYFFFVPKYHLSNQSIFRYRDRYVNKKLIISCILDQSINELTRVVNIIVSSTEMLTHGPALPIKLSILYFIFRFSKKLKISKHSLLRLSTFFNNS